MAAGKVIGADTHTLTVAQMPSHQHSAQTYNGGDATRGFQAYDANISGPTAFTNFEGGGQAHNNIQRTLVGYLWERTA